MFGTLRVSLGLCLSSLLLIAYSGLEGPCLKFVDIINIPRDPYYWN